ncbi:helix-turn-helix domain-containing protein [Kocuria sp. CPCC 205258]|uniref:helix-turn-helix domain-containing protein n=1 Tax=unclassified Kocuria TaxID=2649579 RepID=UPI0034D79C1E
MLTTSQAAALAGISATYLRNLTTEGTLPVQYRGSHRRIRRSDVQAWLAGRQRRDDDGAPAPH